MTKFGSKLCWSFKVLLTIYKALHHLGPGYLSACLALVSRYWQTRSQEQDILMVPCYKLGCVGARAVLVTGLRLWNNQPVEVRQAPTVHHVKHMCKAFLFTQEFGGSGGLNFNVGTEGFKW